jgi:acyl carrier protein
MHDADSEAERRVAACLEVVLGPERATRAAASADLIGDDLLDSFEVVELAARLEAEFGIVIPADRLAPETFRSVAALVALCRELDHDRAARSS